MLLCCVGSSSWFSSASNNPSPKAPKSCPRREGHFTSRVYEQFGDISIGEEKETGDK